MSGAPLYRAFAILLTFVFLMTQIGLSIHGDFEEQGQHSDCAACILVFDELDDDDPVANISTPILSAQFRGIVKPATETFESPIFSVARRRSLARGPPA